MILLLLGVQLAFASWSIVGKVTLGVVPPFALTWLRLLGGALFFGLFALKTGRPLLPPRQERREIVGLSLSGLVINQLCFTVGLARTSAVETTLLVATIPVFAVLYAVLSGRDRVSLRLVLGIGCALAGVSLVALRHGPTTASAHTSHLLGNILILANSASYAVYLVRARPVFARHGAFTVLSWIFTVAALCVAPLGLLSLCSAGSHFGARIWCAIAYVVLVPTLFAYGANAWALARASSTLVAAFIYLQPGIAVILAVSLGDKLALWLGVTPPHERFTLRTLLGLVAILLGVAITTRRSPASNARTVGK
ncbi:MAG: DMT family transporter [Deltaproteobacteria bacterium]|nr:DMT family transporter [Deltaproteobacteria bacterium]